MKILLGDMFKKQNIKVHYSEYLECDDFIASYAQFYKADILSTDSDIACGFPEATYKIYKDYHYTKSQDTPELVLTEHHLKNTLEN